MPSQRTPQGAPGTNTHHTEQSDGTIVCGMCHEDVEDGECGCAVCPSCPQDNCWVHEEGVCGSCQGCEECCECSTCENCSQRTDDSTCGRCNRCEECCRCGCCASCEELTDSDDICSHCDCCLEQSRCCECETCEGCGQTRSRDEICGACEFCDDCGCDCEERPEPVPVTANPATMGRDTFGNEGELPFDTDGGAVEGCACPSCNGDRSRHRAYIRAGGVPPPPRPEPEPNSRGYRCGINFRKRHIRFHDGPATAVVPHTRFAAVEIEIIGATDSTAVNAVCEKWAHSVVGDGSLPDTGYELTTSPASGQKLHELVAETSEALRSAGARVDKRCGLHVHADSRDLDNRALWRLVRIYQKVEPALYAVVTADRFQSSYCQPCGWRWQERMKSLDPNDSDWLARSLSGMTSKYAYKQADIDRWKRDSKRDKGVGRLYDGLNLASHTHRGSVECRIHHGTVDSDKILPWAVLWAGLVQRAKEMTDELVNALPGEPIREDDMDRWDANAWKALEKLAPTAPIRAWLRTRRRQFRDLAKATAKAPRKSKNGEV